jgi:hypothetical protein
MATCFRTPTTAAVGATASTCLREFPRTWRAKTEDYYTLREAKMARDRLPEFRRQIATISSAGRVFQRSEIDRTLPLGLARGWRKVRVRTFYGTRTLFVSVRPFVSTLNDTR